MSFKRRRETASSSSRGGAPPTSSQGVEQKPSGRSAPAPLPSDEKWGTTQVANIGKSISVKGDVTGDEDTVIEGRVHGRVDLKNHHLTVGPNGVVEGELNAKQVTVVGKVNGNVSAIERLELADSSQVSGDLHSPRLLIQEGAQLNGNVSMKGGAAAAAPSSSDGKKLESVSQQKTA